MSRSMCILFVALAIFQAAVASDEVQRKTIRLDSTKVAGSPNDVFGVERGSCSNGALTVGQRRTSDTLWYLDYDYNNDQNVTMEVYLYVAVGRGVIHYVGAVNKSGYSITICDTEQTLGSSEAVVLIKVPPYSIANIFFTLGTH